MISATSWLPVPPEVVSTLIEHGLQHVNAILPQYRKHDSDAHMYGEGSGRKRAQRRFENQLDTSCQMLSSLTPTMLDIFLK